MRPVPSLRSRRVVLPDGERPATIHYAEGRIQRISDGPADMDFGDLAVLPGLVDSHVHVNEPGRTEWEGFSTATRAAIAGGTTTIVDMPLNSIPPTVDVEALEMKTRSAEGKVACDVAFWGGVIPGSLPHVDDLVGAGVRGFKVFTVDSGVDEFPPLDWAAISATAARLDPLGIPLLVHAEEPDELQPPDGDPDAYSTYLRTRPGSAEAAAITRLRKLADGARIHVLHVAGAEAVEALDGSGLSAETCPHYLSFDAESIPDGATEYKCAPPIRSREHRERLWEALDAGLLSMIVSDHSPAPADLKATGDLLSAWGGIASVELRLLATWDEARRRGHSLDRLAGWLAAAPAALAGLANKGRIAEGYDADFVVFDPDGVTQVDALRLSQRHPITPYDGMRLSGQVVATFLGGTQVHGEGAEPGVLGSLLRGDTVG